MKRAVKFLIDSPTNQQFVVLDQDTIRRLEEQVAFSIWEPVDENHTAVRFATSWATTPEMVDALWSCFKEQEQGRNKISAEMKGSVRSQKLVVLDGSLFFLL